MTEASSAPRCHEGPSSLPATALRIRTSPEPLDTKAAPNSPPAGRPRSSRPRATATRPSRSSATVAMVGPEPHTAPEVSLGSPTGDAGGFSAENATWPPRRAATEPAAGGADRNGSDELDAGHGGVVAVAGAELEDAGVAVVTGRLP